MVPLCQTQVITVRGFQMLQSRCSASMVPLYHRPLYRRPDGGDRRRTSTSHVRPGTRRDDRKDGRTETTAGRKRRENREERHDASITNSSGERPRDRGRVLRNPRTGSPVRDRGSVPIRKVGSPSPTPPFRLERPDNPVPGARRPAVRTPEPAGARFPGKSPRSRPFLPFAPVRGVQALSFPF